MKGKSSLKEEGHRVRGEIKGAISPPRRESSTEASPNLAEGLQWGPGGDAGGWCWRRLLGPDGPWSHRGTFQLSEKGVDDKS